MSGTLPGFRFPAFLALVTLVFSCFCETAVAQSGQVTPTTPAPTNPALLAKLTEVSAFEQFAAYWTIEAGWHSELQLRNNLANRDLTVTPALRAADGSEASLAAVTIPPSDTRTIDVQAALSVAAPTFAGKYGSPPATTNRAAMARRHLSLTSWHPTGKAESGRWTRPTTRSLRQAMAANRRCVRA